MNVYFCVVEGGMIKARTTGLTHAGDLLVLPYSEGQISAAPVGWTKVVGGYWHIVTASDYIPTTMEG